MLILFGTRLLTWGSGLTQNVWRCAKCGHEGQFYEKTGRRFLTLYWIIPLFPVSGKLKMVQCPQCKTKYPDNMPANTPGAPGAAPIPSPWSD